MSYYDHDQSDVGEVVLSPTQDDVDFSLSDGGVRQAYLDRGRQYNKYTVPEGTRNKRLANDIIKMLESQNDNESKSSFQFNSSSQEYHRPCKKRFASPTESSPKRTKIESPSNCDSVVPVSDSSDIYSPHLTWSESKPESVLSSHGSYSFNRSLSRSESRNRSHSSSTLSVGKDEIFKTDDMIVISSEDDDEDNTALSPYYRALQGCRSVVEYQFLNKIDEGTYGVVYRARDKKTDEIVAIKRLKAVNGNNPLREIDMLRMGEHPNIVSLREVVRDPNVDKIFIVMEYVEHDLYSLIKSMRLNNQMFLPGEVKCLMTQLLKAVHHLHDNWILHRDLKTSNLLLSNKGVLKVGDFGLAREYGSPLVPYSPLVVTLWYRAPELLLCCKEYSSHIDIWSVGCIFAELISMNPLFPGKSEMDQLNRIFRDMGTPSEMIWPGYSELPAVQLFNFSEYPSGGLRQRIGSNLLSESGLALLNQFLTYDPARRVTADAALEHAYFKEQPLAVEPATFPTWPAKSEGNRRSSPYPSPPADGAVSDEALSFQLQLNVMPGFSFKH